MSYAAAQLALEVQLAFPLATWLVQWPNGPKITPNGVPYAEVLHMQGRASVDTLGQHGDDLIPGITQVDLYYKLESGNVKAAEDVDAFRAMFAAGQWLVNDGQAVLVRGCGPGPARREGNYYKSIIEIQWEARIAR